MTEAHENEDGSGRKTSKLRHFFDIVQGESHQKIETVDPSVFSFYNRFWLSFYIEDQVYDKRFLIRPFAEYDLDDLEQLELKGKLAE